MIEIGINDGDYVAVKEQPTCNNGDIVVAIVDDGATVKRFYKERVTCVCSPKFIDGAIIVRENVSIAGKVSCRLPTFIIFQAGSSIRRQYLRRPWLLRSRDETTRAFL